MPPILTGVALRYPEKTSVLGQVFNHTTNSYKLFWFLALLSLLRRRDASTLRLADVLAEMAARAWHPVCLFRLSLGSRDKLQEVVLEVQSMSGLAPNAKPEAIRRFVEGSVSARAELAYFSRYVPTRFLAPWFEGELRGKPDTQRTALITTLANDSQRSPRASLYCFEKAGADGVIRLNDSWRSFLLENLGIIEAFAEHHLAMYLQARSPNVPGVMNKLRAPTARQLTDARRFWKLVRAGLERAGESSEFLDIYSKQQLGERFAIDHFLPWSFVTHDLLWNLAPVGTTNPNTNAEKSDSLPDLGIHVPRLARLHFRAIRVVRHSTKLLEDYTECFKQDVNGLLALGETGLAAKYREVIEPQAQIASNLGFSSGWKLRNR